MTGALATFAIIAAGTVLGLIIARFSSNTRRETAMTIQEFADRQRELLSALEQQAQQAREIRERLEKEKQGSPRETAAHF